MTERQLKYRAGLYIVALHTIILLGLIVLRLLHGFDTPEFTTILAVIVPIFSSYTAGILTFIIRDRHTKVDRTPTVTAAYSALLFIAPTVLGAIVLVSIVLQAYRLAFDNFEDFKTFLIAVESAFGIYVNILVFAVFDRIQKDPQ